MESLPQFFLIATTCSIFFSIQEISSEAQCVDIALQHLMLPGASRHFMNGLFRLAYKRGDRSEEIGGM